MGMRAGVCALGRWPRWRAKGEPAGGERRGMRDGVEAYMGGDERAKTA